MPSLTVTLTGETSAHFCAFSSANSLSRIARSSASAALAGSSIVMASARTRFARLTIPTSLPSRTTGTRLIRLVSSRSAMSATGVVSVTERTLRVMTSFTLPLCDLM
jgi:hypothetical protein